MERDGFNRTPVLARQGLLPKCNSRICNRTVNRGERFCGPRCRSRFQAGA